MLGDGSYVVTWQKTGDGDGMRIYARRYNSNGSANGNEFQVNQTTTGIRAQSSIAALDTENFVVVWSGQGAADTDGVFARQYSFALPVLDLDSNNSSGATGSDFNANYADGDAAVLVVDTDATLTDADDANLQSLNVTITNRQDGSSETLSAVTTGTSITASYTSGVLTLSGSDTVAHYQQVLRTIKYSNGQSPTTGTSRTITFVANDGVMIGSPDTGPSTVTYDSSEGTTAPQLLVTFSIPNEPPVITSNGGGTTGTVNIEENATSVTTVVATDTNLPGQTLTYSINGGADAAKFSINSSTGMLSFASAPNYELPGDVGANNIYDVIVQVSDGIATDSQFLAVTVTAVNDNTPTITSNGSEATASISVAENSTTVTTVTATDADLPTQTLTYSISGGADAARFAIDSNTGILRFLAAPDYETPTDNGTNNIYNVVIRVSDGAWADTQSIDVSVTNVNERPVANTESYSVNEDTTLTISGSGVLTNDTDPENDAMNVVLIDGVSHGSLTLNSDGSFVYTPDSNFYGQDSFRYAASDGSLNSVPIVVTLNILAVNDAPVVSLANGQITYKEQASPRSLDSSLTISDIDSSNLTGATVTITNGLASGPDELIFTSVSGITSVFDAATDTLTFSGTASVSDYQTLLRSVRFRNLSDTPFASVRTVTVQVTDGTATGSDFRNIQVTAVNEAPVITSNGGSSFTTLNVNEYTTAVTTVTSSDVDGGIASYVIVGGNDRDLFQINSTTGVLEFVTAQQFLSPVDANGDNVYEVQVRASDGNGGSDTQSLQIQLMTEVVNVLRIKAEQQELNLSIRIRGAIPETIQADPTRLRQILMNLVGNAIKFTQEGSVTIVASMVEQNGRPFVRFEVQDTGIGMTEEQMGRLFQEFMQADSSVTRRFGGTGLGLAISKKLTEAMGGKIAVDSEIGVGSTFHFCIDAGELAGVAMLDEQHAAEQFQAASRQKQDGLKIWFKPTRILITDDTPANRQLAGLVLRKAGLIVDEAENGAIAVEKASTGQYELLLMDMQMPVMDGFTATRTLRDAGFTKPILAFTANVMEQDRQRCAAAGCSGFLTKPINIDLLLNTMAEFLPTQDFPPESVASPAIAPAVSLLINGVRTDKADPAEISDTVEPIQTAGIMASSEDSAKNQTTNSTSEPVQLHRPSSTTSFLDELLMDLPGISARNEQAAGSTRPIVDTSAATPVTPAPPKPVPPKAAPPKKRQPIHSTLPLDIPEFREIVQSFVGAMDDTLSGLRAAQARMDYQEIREVAHRLKGTGGTVGFNAFTEPSRKLQLAAEERHDETIEAMLVELEEICERIEMPVMI